MARLSAPANDTPKSERKSKGIRNLFKHRPSYSASSSPVTPANLPPLTNSSPLPSPTIRSGFKQIGLLPSERSYSNLFRRAKQQEGGSTVSVEEGQSPTSAGSSYNKTAGLRDEEDELEKMRQESQSRLESLNDVLSKYPTEQAAHEAAIAEVAATDMPPVALIEEDKRSSLPLGSSHKIAEAMHGRHPYHLSSHASTDTVIEKNHSSRRNVGPTGVQNLSLGSICKQSHLELPCHVANKSTDVSQANLESDQDYSESLNPEEYKARSNVFDDESSLSQRIREYVASKIAEALVNHDGMGIGRHRQTGSAPVHVTVNIDMSGLAKSSMNTEPGSDKAKADISQGPATIGPLTVSDCRVAGYVLLAITGLYAILLLGASFMGPITLLSTLWKIAIVLGVYTVVIEELHWSEHIERDLVLAPVCYAVGMVQSIIEQVLGQARAAAVSVVVEALQIVTKDMDLHVSH
jgi:hypothetical protein